MLCCQLFPTHHTPPPSHLPLPVRGDAHLLPHPPHQSTRQLQLPRHHAMVHITRDLIRRRAEHNEYMLSTLEEVALHQQNIEAICGVLGQLCPRLRIVYLQGNLIGKIQNLHKLKELEYLNLAINNITKVQNLQRCESLARLDLTVNFIPKAGLLSLASLAGSFNLRELFLTGNPCTDWPGYRQYVVASLPQLAKLDGQAIVPSERIAARQALPGLDAQLRRELAAEGVDVAAAACVEDDGDDADLAAAEVAETGYVDEHGELRRPWCPATRILEHWEMEKANQEADAAKAAAAAAARDPLAEQQQPARLEDFPTLPADGRVLQRNEGRWDFTLDEADDGSALVLDVAVGKFLDTSLIKADVQPRLVRLLIKGRLLQLVLPVEVRPDSSVAQRSAASGRLVMVMPKEDPAERLVDVAYLRPATTGKKPRGMPACAAAAAGPISLTAVGASRRRHTPSACSRSSSSGKPAARAGSTCTTGSGDFLLREVRKAAVTVGGRGGAGGCSDDDDDVPDLVG